MKRYRVESPVIVHPGAVLGLSEEQVRRRAFALTKEGKFWRVQKPVGFKAGEIILVKNEEVLPKASVLCLEEDQAKSSAPAPAPAPTPAPALATGEQNQQPLLPT